LTQWKGEREKKGEEKKIVHSLVLSINVALPYGHREKELKKQERERKKKKHYVLLNTAKRSINRSTVAYLVRLLSFFSSSI
jgi:hypothetical protein